MDAIVTVRFKILDICNPEDLVDADMTFDEMVRYEIQEEGLTSIVDDEGEIMSVEQVIP
jgi:hypothetical protein